MRKINVFILALLTSINLLSQIEYLDPEFGEQGILDLELPNFETIYNYSVDYDNRLYISYVHTPNRDSARFYLLRLNEDGSQDPTLASIEDLGLESGYNWPKSGYALQNENRLVMHKTFSNLRDTLFVLTTDLEFIQSYVLPDSLKNTNSIFYSNLTEEGDLYYIIDSTLFKFNPDGNLDPNFASDGALRFPKKEAEVKLFYHFPMVNSTNLDGGVFLSEYKTNLDGSRSYNLLKLTKEGSLDKAFGNQGKIKMDSVWLGYALYELPNGKIITTQFYVPALDSINYNTIQRFNPDGSIDSLFGTNGMITTESSINSDSIFLYYTFVLDDFEDGSILTYDYYYSRAADSSIWNTKSLLSKYDQQGKLDEAFGNQGRLPFDLGTENTSYSVIRDLDHNLYVYAIDIIQDSIYNQRIYKLDGRKLFNLADDEEETDPPNRPLAELIATPNPGSRERIRFIYNSDDVNEKRYFVFSSLGKLIDHGNYTPRDTFDYLHLRLAAYSSGTYILKLVDTVDNSELITKFILH